MSIAGKQIKRPEKNPELLIFELMNELILKPGLLLEYWLEELGGVFTVQISLICVWFAFSGLVTDTELSKYLTQDKTKHECTRTITHKRESRGNNE